MPDITCCMSATPECKYVWAKTSHFPSLTHTHRDTHRDTDCIPVLYLRSWVSICVGWDGPVSEAHVLCGWSWKRPCAQARSCNVSLSQIHRDRTQHRPSRRRSESELSAFCRGSRGFNNLAERLINLIQRFLSVSFSEFTNWDQERH